VIQVWGDSGLGWRSASALGLVSGLKKGLYSLLKNPPLLLLLGGAAVHRFCTCFWVAQRFTAAIKGLL
jgi:hypothetical protein